MKFQELLHVLLEGQSFCVYFKGDVVFDGIFSWDDFNSDGRLGDDLLYGTVHHIRTNSDNQLSVTII